MLDPFAPPPWLRTAAEPVGRLLHLNTLPLHAHEILFGFALYSFVNSVLAPFLSVRLFATTYRGFSRRTQLQWNMHVTSLINSAFLSVAFPYVLLADRDRANGTWEERLWGYTGASGLVQGLGAGYFMWDVMVCIANFGTLGAPDLLHAVVALCISVLGFVRVPRFLSLLASHRIHVLIVSPPNSAHLGPTTASSMALLSSQRRSSTSTGFSTRQAGPGRCSRWPTALCW